jgi:DNA-binding transcriptional LysR family regulator
MLNWDDMRYLLAVARSGSMSGAARLLEVNHATVIRRIRSLEEQLGTPLFDRIGHNYSITPAGQVAFDAAEQMETQSVGVERMVLGQVAGLSGTIRVTAPDPLIKSFILPGLSLFSERYPEILVDLSPSMRSYDLGSREADVAFRVTTSPPEDLVGSKIVNLMMAVYVPAGSNMVAADIEKVIVMSTQDDYLPDWATRYCPRARPGLVTDSPPLELEAIKQGFGAGRLPCGMGDGDPGLERVPDIPLEEGSQLWMLTHVDVRSNARIRVFRDFMLEYMEERSDLMQVLSGNLAT